ncbi:TetR/AcrR family transcriptional regulator [Paenibacillus sp. CAU 1782]
MKKQDRRIKYTKMMIRESFIRFLKEKPISKITVKEICLAADINRATFYSHYTDQYDLLHQIEEEVITDITHYLQEFHFEDIEQIVSAGVERILDYIGKNAELFDLLLNIHGNLKFQQDVVKLIGVQHFIPVPDGNSNDPYHAEYLFHFLASGAIGLIQLWLKDGMKKPAKELADLILKAALNGRNAFMI